MAQQQQEDGWPLGLHPLNVRVGLVRSRDLSFSTLLTRSTSSSPNSSSSDLDTESTGSFFRDNSITLGSLIGISSVLELSRRSTRGRVPEPTIRKKKTYKSRTWLFSLCSKLSADAVNMSNTQSLGHFLQAERQASNMYRNDQNPSIYCPDDFSHTLPASDANSLFLEDHIAPPQSSTCSGQDGERISGGIIQNDRYGTPMIFSCLCGNLTQ